MEDFGHDEFVWSNGRVARRAENRAIECVLMEAEVRTKTLSFTSINPSLSGCFMILREPSPFSSAKSGSIRPMMDRIHRPCCMITGGIDDAVNKKVSMASSK